MTDVGAEEVHVRAVPSMREIQETHSTALGTSRATRRLPLKVTVTIISGHSMPKGRKVGPAMNWRLRKLFSAIYENDDTRQRGPLALEGILGLTGQPLNLAEVGVVPSTSWSIWLPLPAAAISHSLSYQGSPT
jgi:hypothetical protein